MRAGIIMYNALWNSVARRGDVVDVLCIGEVGYKDIGFMQNGF